MHEITKTISAYVDGKSKGFRLTKPEVFSGETLPRMFSGMPKESGGNSVLGFITSLSEPDLRSLMVTCLQHCEVLLAAAAPVIHQTSNSSVQAPASINVTAAGSDPAQAFVFFVFPQTEHVQLSNLV